MLLIFPIKIWRIFIEIQNYLYDLFLNIAGEFSTGNILNKIRSYIFLNMLNALFITNIVITLSIIFSFKIIFEYNAYVFLCFLGIFSSFITWICVKKRFSSSDDYRSAVKNIKFINLYSVGYILLQIIWLIFNKYFFN